MFRRWKPVCVHRLRFCYKKNAHVRVRHAKQIATKHVNQTQKSESLNRYASKCERVRWPPRERTGASTRATLHRHLNNGRQVRTLRDTQKPETRVCLGFISLQSTGPSGSSIVRSSTHILKKSSELNLSLAVKKCSMLIYISDC